jgi:hypothetical protein
LGFYWDYNENKKTNHVPVTQRTLAKNWIKKQRFLTHKSILAKRIIGRN